MYAYEKKDVETDAKTADVKYTKRCDTDYIEKGKPKPKVYKPYPKNGEDEEEEEEDQVSVNEYTTGNMYHCSPLSTSRSARRCPSRPATTGPRWEFNIIIYIYILLTVLPYYIVMHSIVG